MLKASALGDDAGKPSQSNSSPAEKPDTGKIHTGEMLEMTPGSRNRSVDWFHRLQKERLGIPRRQEPESWADGRTRNR